MRNKDRSLFLSLTLVRAFLGFVPALCICAPWMVRWYDTVSMDRIGLLDGSVFMPLLTCLYCAAVCGEVCLYFLHRLLCALRRDMVFTLENCRCLRIISWCCILAALPFLAFGFWRSISFVVALAAVFFGIILRVVKNVFDKAVLLQEENDYTI